MKDLFERWLTSKAAAMKPSTTQMYRGQFHSFFHYFKGKQVTDLTTPDIAAWLDHQLKKDKLKPSTVLNHQKFARSFLEWCVDEAIITANPINPKRLPKIKMNKPDKRPFTYEQYLRVLRTITDDTFRAEMWRAACAVAWHTGMRQGDCSTLAWANVNFDDGIITAWPEKKSSVRECLFIPIEPDLREVLLRLRNENPDSQYVNYSFYTVYRLQRNDLTHEFGRICDKAGLPDHSFHSFRHGFVTRLINAGVDSITISSMTGQSLEIIQGYAHVSTDAKHAALERSRAALQTRAVETRIEVAI